MFDIGWSELLVIGVVALIAIGPKELPAVLRSIGQWTGKIRRMASEFQGQFQEAMRELEMSDLKKQVDEVTSGFNAKFDPLDFGDASPKLDSATGDQPAGPATIAGAAEATPPSGTPEPPAVTEPYAAAPESASAAPPATGEESRPA